MCVCVCVCVRACVRVCVAQPLESCPDHETNDLGLFSSVLFLASSLSISDLVNRDWCHA